MQVDAIDVNANAGYSNILENDRMFSQSGKAEPDITTEDTESTESTETAEANAGTTDTRSGEVFAGPLTSELADGPSKLRSICCANDLHWQHI
jgi:hypothetical protein